MAALRGDGDLEQAFTGGDGPASGGEATGRHPRNIVHGEHPIDGEPGEQPVPDHRRRAKPMFLIRLEDEDDAAVEIAMARQMRRRPQQHAGMAVMAFGMHHAVVR